MKKQIVLLFLILLSFSCGKSDGGGGQSEEVLSDQTTDFIVPEDIATTGPDEDIVEAPIDIIDDQVPDLVPDLSQTFKVNITYINFTTAQKTKYEKAIAIVKKVVASEEFKTRVLNHAYGGKLTYVDNRGISNEGIYQNILNGNEKLRPENNNQMDVEVELYYENTSTIGYTYPSSKRIWVNTKYFNNYTPSSVAGNLFHEWLHKLGYGHASTYSVSRDYSVPYAIGRMISSLGKKYE